MPYNFDLNQAYIKQESTINSILESRLVPRDLSEFDSFEGSKTEAYIYVDNDGKESKLSLYDVFDGKISVVTDLPKDAEEGQLVLHKIGENKYDLQIFEDGLWKILSIRSKAEVININPTEHMDVSNVQSALENLDSRVYDITEGSVHSLNEFVGDVEIKGGINIVISSSDNSIYINAPDVETHEEAEQLKKYLEEYADQSEADAKAYADEINKETNDKFDAEVERLDKKIDDEVVTLNERIDSEVITLNETINDLSEDVYHKDVIKPIALTGEASDIHVNDIREIYSNQLQEVLVQINNKAETGGAVVELRIEKLDTPSGDNLETYRLMFNNFPAGDYINIPKDYVIKSSDNPIPGLLENDFFLDIVVNTRDNSVEDEHIYCSLASINEELDKKANIDDLAIVAFSGSYNDLEDKLVAGSGIEITKDSEGNNIINNLKEAIWGNIVGDINDQLDLKDRLEALDESIQSESVAREEADEALKVEIKDIIQPEIDSLSDKLDIEIQERLDSEGNIIAMINQEILDRVDGDDTLHGRIDVVEEYLETESENRIAGDNQLREDLDEEIARAKESEIVLREYIDSEGNRAIMAEELLSEALNEEIDRSITRDDDLDEKIELLTERLDSEGNVIFERLDDLQDQLDSEIDRAIEREDQLEVLLEEEIDRAKAEELKLYEYIDSEGNRAIDAERLIQEALDNEIERATIRENELGQSVKKVANRINTTVVEDLKVKEYQPDKVVLEVNKTNIYSQAKSSKLENLLLANSERAGLMSPSDVDAIGDLNSRVESLEGTTHRLLYTGPEDPTPEDINEFAESLGYQNPFTGIAVVVEHTDEYIDSEGTVVIIHSLHIWHYYENRGEWMDDGTDTVTNFSNKYPGVIKGSLDEGKVYAESDGTGSVNGWSELTMQVNNLEGNSATKSELADEIMERENADIALQADIHRAESVLTEAIENEASQREDEDSGLANRITTEASQREAEDTEIRSEISDLSGEFTSHTENKNNPHEVTKAQVGLGSVVNTGDSDTPTQGGTTKFTTGGAYTELNKKVDKVSGKSLLEDTEITRLTNIASGATKVEKGTNNGDIKVTSRSNGSESSSQVNVYTHPAYTANTPAAVKVGNDSTGHVVIGSQLTGADVGVTATTTSVTVDGTTFNQYVHPAGDAADVSLGFYKISTDENSHVKSTEAVGSADILALDTYISGPGLIQEDTASNQRKFSTSYTTTMISTSDWSSAGGVIMATKNIPGVTADSSPVLDIIIDSSSTLEEIDTLKDCWHSVYSAEAAAGKIYFYATAIPTVDMIIAIKGY